MALRRQVVYFIRLNFLGDTYQIGGIGHITLVQLQAYFGLVRILIQVIDPVGIKR